MTAHNAELERLESRPSREAATSKLWVNGRLVAVPRDVSTEFARVLVAGLVPVKDTP